MIAAGFSLSSIRHGAFAGYHSGFSSKKFGNWGDGGVVLDLYCSAPGSRLQRHSGVTGRAKIPGR